MNTKTETETPTTFHFETDTASVDFDRTGHRVLIWTEAKDEAGTEFEFEIKVGVDVTSQRVLSEYWGSFKFHTEVTTEIGEITGTAYSDHGERPITSDDADQIWEAFESWIEEAISVGLTFG